MQNWYKISKTFAIGEDGLEHSWQKEFPKSTECCRCGANARIGFVMKEDNKDKEYICDLHPNEMADGGKAWLHDACAVAVYFCEKCLDTTALYNQG